MSTKEGESKKLIEMLEEDDEFEEFEVEGKFLYHRTFCYNVLSLEWTKNDENEEGCAYVEDWDDDQADEDFIGQLRKELKM